MRKLLYILILCCISVCYSQDLVLTHDGNAWVKNEINALKVLLEVYGDSVTNSILMGQVHMPGKVYIGFNEKLEIDSIGFFGDWRFATDAFKKRMENAIRNHRYFALTDLSEDEVMKENANGCRYGMAPFSPVGNFSTIFTMDGYLKIKKNEIQSNYRLVDYAKKRIAEVDSIYVKDINGKLWR